MLEFRKLEFLTASTVQRVNMRHRAKFRADRSIRRRDMTIFRYFKTEVVCHIGFLKVRKFSHWYGSENQCASPRQIWCRSDN